MNREKTMVSTHWAFEFGGIIIYRGLCIFVVNRRVIRIGPYSPSVGHRPPILIGPLYMHIEHTTMSFSMTACVPLYIMYRRPLSCASVRVMQFPHTVNM